ncbi:hypothetical protein [Nonomuraea sp. NPDC003709]|uniref:hypothetical protein n=1 Tax=Nonomuraea sp. NPDC003709 TaxID=3154450 RepID=UPI0033A25696
MGGKGVGSVARLEVTATKGFALREVAAIQVERTGIVGNRAETECAQTVRHVGDVRPFAFDARTVAGLVRAGDPVCLQP